MKKGVWFGNDFTFKLNLRKDEQTWISEPDVPYLIAAVKFGFGCQWKHSALNWNNNRKNKHAKLKKSVSLAGWNHMFLIRNMKKIQVLCQFLKPITVKVLKPNWSKKAKNEVKRNRSSTHTKINLQFIIKYDLKHNKHLEI